MLCSKTGGDLCGGWNFVNAKSGHRMIACVPNAPVDKRTPSAASATPGDLPSELAEPRRWRTQAASVVVQQHRSGITLPGEDVMRKMQLNLQPVDHDR